MTTNKRTAKTSFALMMAMFPLAATAQEVVPETLQVEQIRCAGNQRTTCDFIRNHLYIRPGEKLNEDEIRNAELRLSALRNFESVHIHLERGSQHGEVAVVIEVAEANPIAMEWLAGASARLDLRNVVIGGRIADQNLFGAGKVLDLTVVGGIPMGGDGKFESYEATLRYADPHLFNSQRWFAVAKAGYHKRDFEDIYGNFQHLDTLQLDLDVGLRFGNFSYFTTGFSWRPNLEWTLGRWQSDGRFEISSPDYYATTVNLIYGWSTEDDLYFPTGGSSFQIAVGGDYGANSPNRQSHLQLRKTWHWADAYWTFKIGGAPSPDYRTSFDESQLLALTYAHPLAGGDDVRRARWYVEPGFGGAGLDPQGRQLYELGLKIGYRADTRAFGVVNFYVFGSVDPNR
jgi:outer membrane protein assembly factor BamA